MVFVGLNNRNEESINESGDSDSDEEEVHEGLSQSTHMDNVNEARQDVNWSKRNNCEKGRKAKRDHT